MKIAMWIYLLSAVTCLSQAFMQIIIPQFLSDRERRDSSRERHNDWYSPTLTWGQVLACVLWPLVPVVNTIGTVIFTLESLSSFFEWIGAKLNKPVVPKDTP